MYIFIANVKWIESKDIDETPSVLEQSFKAATKLKRELPTDLEKKIVTFMELSSLA